MHHVRKFLILRILLIPNMTGTLLSPPVNLPDLHQSQEQPVKKGGG